MESSGIDNVNLPSSVEAERAVLGAILVDIEQDADVVAFIHRESYYNRDEKGQEDPTTSDTADIIIAKQRNGPTGTIKLAYLARITAFDNLEMRHWAHEGCQAT
jgi:replicative DNA helicase